MIDTLRQLAQRGEAVLAPDFLLARVHQEHAAGILVAAQVAIDHPLPLAALGGADEGNRGRRQDSCGRSKHACGVSSQICCQSVLALTTMASCGRKVSCDISSVLASLGGCDGIGGRLAVPL